MSKDGFVGMSVNSDGSAELDLPNGNQRSTYDVMIERTEKECPSFRVALVDPSNEPIDFAFRFLCDQIDDLIRENRDLSRRLDRYEGKNITNLVGKPIK